MVTAGVFTGVLLFLMAIPASLIGWRANINYLNDWRARVVTNEHVARDSNFNIHSYRNQSLANAVYLWDNRNPIADAQAQPMPNRSERSGHIAVRVLIGLIVAALFMVCYLLGRRDDRLDQAVAYALACCATLLVSPISWGHYYMVEAPAALVIPLWLLRRGRPTQAIVVAAVPPVLSWSHYVAMPYVGGLGVLGLGTMVWFLGVCGLIIGQETSDAPAATRSQFRLRRLIFRTGLDWRLLPLTRVESAVSQEWNKARLGAHQLEPMDML
jgi:hypothetical protein